MDVTAKKLFKRLCGAFEVPCKGAHEFQLEKNPRHGNTDKEIGLFCRIYSVACSSRREPKDLEHRFAHPRAGNGTLGGEGRLSTSRIHRGSPPEGFKSTRSINPGRSSRIGAVREILSQRRNFHSTTRAMVAASKNDRG